MLRVVEPEWLDELPPPDPQARGSRADLRRLNRIMGHAGIFSRAFFQNMDPAIFLTRPVLVCELGAGDGTLLLRLAQCWSVRGVHAEVETVDLRPLVTEPTRRAFEALQWRIRPVVADALAWTRQSSRPVDVILCNLFLHHFPDPQLRALLRGIAERSTLFIACEPRRSRVALSASRLVGLIGCNRVTRHDAEVSVRAGFADQELSALWPSGGGWKLREGKAGMFSHCFVAQRHA